MAIKAVSYNENDEPVCELYGETMTKIGAVADSLRGTWDRMEACEIEEEKGDG